MSNSNFIFDLGAKVIRKANSKPGTIKARSQYHQGYLPNHYLIEYVDGQGDVQTEWLTESELST